MGTPTTRCVGLSVSCTRKRWASRLSCRVSAGDNQGREPSAQATMNLEKARELLKVQKGASFDEVLKAKKKLKDGKDLEEGQVTRIDAAYDVLLMDSLRNRQEVRGVSKDVRYADVPKAKPVSQVANELLQKLPGNVQVSVGSRGRANQDESVTFGIISLWVYLQAASTPITYTADSPGSEIAAAVIASLYFQRQEKKMGLGRAVAITAGGLPVGTLIGSGVEALVRVDLAPFLGVHSPAMVVGQYSVIGVWMAY